MLTPEKVNDFRETLSQLYKTDNYFGPRVLVPVIAAHLNEIEHLRIDAHGALLRSLLSVGSSYAEFAGWLAQDSGDQHDAVTSYNKALEWAQLAGDVRLAAFVKMRLAAQAITVRDSEYAVLWASSAQQDDSPETTRIRVIAALTEAHGHALGGAAGEVDRALDTACGLIEGGADLFDGDPTAGRYCELPLYMNIARAKCNVALGRGGEAATDFAGILAELPPRYQRDRGQYMAGLAEAHVIAGQPDEAYAVVRDSFAIAVTAGSERTMGSLRRVVKLGLKRWPSHPDGTELAATLITAHNRNGGN